MGRDHPDGTSQALHAEVSLGQVTRPLPTMERIVSLPGRISTSSLAYVEVERYTVPAGFTGVVRDIECMGDNLPNTRWALRQSSGYVWQDFIAPTAFSIPVSDLHMAPGDWVSMEAHSIDGGTITAWAHIVGKEVFVP